MGPRRLRETAQDLSNFRTVVATGIAIQPMLNGHVRSARVNGSAGFKFGLKEPMPFWALRLADTRCAAKGHRCCREERK